MNFRLGHAIPNPQHHSKRQSLNCQSQSFYTAPQNNANATSGQPLTISWDKSYSSCLDGSTNIDIYLLSPTVDGGHVKVFSSIAFDSGSTTKTIDSGWWNNTGDIKLQVSIAPSDEAFFASNFAAGPVLYVTYDPNASSTNSTSDPNLKTAGVAQRGGIPKGAIAAAVLLPIIIIGLVIFFYIRISRKKQVEERRRFSQAVDARMSRLSGDWQAMTARGAHQAALRDSIASGAGMRMSAVMAQGRQRERESWARPSGEEFSRTSRFGGAGVGTGERQSRISFAADTNASKDRLSTYSQTQSRASRAYHFSNTNEAPPVPSVPGVYDGMQSMYGTEGHSYYSEEGASVMSPTQTRGAVALSTDDIYGPPPGEEDISGALAMMRTGGTNNTALQSKEDLLLPPPTPALIAPPSPLQSSYNAPPLSPLGIAPMQHDSPDALLKNYAAGARSPAASSYASSFTASGMRNLTGDKSLGQ